VRGVNNLITPGDATLARHEWHSETSTKRARSGGVEQGGGRGGSARGIIRVINGRRNRAAYERVSRLSDDRRVSYAVNGRESTAR